MFISCERRHSWLYLSGKQRKPRHIRKWCLVALYSECGIRKHWWSRNYLPYYLVNLCSAKPSASSAACLRTLSSSSLSLSRDTFCWVESSWSSASASLNTEDDVFILCFFHLKYGKIPLSIKYLLHSVSMACHRLHHFDLMVATSQIYLVLFLHSLILISPALEFSDVQSIQITHSTADFLRGSRSNFHTHWTLWKH